jgi:hypothetical protein
LVHCQGPRHALSARTSRLFGFAVYDEVNGGCTVKRLGACWSEPPAKEECVSRPVRQVGIRVQPGCQSAAIPVRSVTRRRHGGVSNGERGGSLGRTRLHPYGTAFRASDLEPQDRAVILRRLDREDLLNHNFRALGAQTEAPCARFIMPPPAKKACHARPRPRCWFPPTLSGSSASVSCTASIGPVSHRQPSNWPSRAIPLAPSAGNS